MFAWCDARDVSGAFALSLATMAARSDCPVTSYARLQTGPRLAEARNQLVDGFARSDCEWLLFVDSDMVFAADMPQRLLAAGHPIVGALCRTSEGKPTMFRFLNAELDSERVTEWDDGEIVEVDATGTGCLLVHRSVFARMKEAFATLPSGAENPYPWFVEGMTSLKGDPFGEDTAFMVRARSLGIPVFVHTGVKVGHVKTQVIGEVA